MIDEIIAAAKELRESRESFPFSGIDPVSYSEMKAIEIELPGYRTPVDTLLDRFRAEGMKVALGKYPESRDVYIVPAGRSEAPNDDMYIFPRHLQVNDMMDDRVKKLIIMDKNKRKFLGEMK